MPQPLRKVGDIRDKLYWDSVNNKYLIEKNIFGKQLNNKFTSYPEVYESVMKSGMILAHSNVNGELKGSTFVAKGYTSIFDGHTIPFNIYQKWAVIVVSLPLSVLSDSTVEAFNAYLDENPIYVYYPVESQYVQIIETKILEKPSLETYSPKTYITTNTEIQPSKMTVTNKRNLINLKKIKANTDYTVQLKCNEKGNKPIKINLCGKEKDIDATIGVNHVNITTNELNDNKLELSGEGNIVSEIIVVEGEMNQYPEYFNGVQSTGELQDDGTYRIGIKTNEGFNISIQTNNPLAKGDKLYWNKSNKRYEIDRGGSIEVPTVSGDIIDLPRLYQREDTHFSTSTGNIKPSKIKLDYNDLD